MLVFPIYIIFRCKASAPYKQTRLFLHHSAAAAITAAGSPTRQDRIILLATAFANDLTKVFGTAAVVT